MFLHILNDRQQRAFLALAQRFVEADSHLSSEERNLLELMRAEMGLSFDDEIPSADTRELLQAFDTGQARAAVVLELLGVGHADEHFSPEESALLNEVAQSFGITPEKLARFDDWVQRQLALAREAEEFWAE